MKSIRLWPVVAASILVATPAFAQDKAGSPIRSVDIAQGDDGYVATLVMQAPVSPKIAWDVLTDFDNMQKWVPNVKESKITSNEGNTLTIEQKGTAKFGLLSIPYTSVRKMQLDPGKSILATQVSGSMKKLVSLMRVTPDASGTRLDYKLELVPSAIASSVMSKDFLQHELTEQFKAIVGEMVRRAK
jgi:carbon monoxide dehydrogenase subunit G